VRFLRRALFVAFASGLLVRGAAAQEIASADLQIQGVGLKVVTVSASTGLDIPVAIQTEFGGKQNDDAPAVEGLLAVGELTGPGIDSPIRLETAPGHKFQIPGLSREGVYFLQNIRLMKGSDFLQPATPSIASITVSNLLQTSVRVKQLTPEDLRARGISIDLRNYDVFEYTFSFLVNGQVVEIPFPVVIDSRTHEVRELPRETPYKLPEIGAITPPRWDPPDMFTFELTDGGELPQTTEDPAQKGGGARISIPAALVIPNSLAVLHQFFAVTLMVTNGAPTGSSVTLDSVTALIKPPAPLRTAKSIPAVAFGQPVPIVDATTGVTFLVAQAKGEAEWTMEGLQPGTHTVEVEVKATYKSPGQADFPLKGTARATVVIHDPRFNVNFSHPDTVRKDIEYSTYSFITNMSGSVQNIKVTNGLPACADSPGSNVCRVDGTPASHDLSIPPGEMRMIEYKLKPGITGHVFATAGSVSDDAITASVQLFMGVSESGIPLSPATLVMPYYARFVSQNMVSANLQLLGLGYSLATAPLTAALAQHPHVIKSDVFQRAVDIARAGQRVFLGEPMRDALAHMQLDLLGNSLQLDEWDALRRQEKTGRIGAAAVAREIETALGTGTTDDFVSRFAAVTAWRAPYLLAVTKNAKLSVKDATTNAKMEVASEAASGWIRQLPNGEVTTFQSGELAVVGRWAGDYSIGVTPAADGPVSLDVILPAAADGSVLRAHFDFTGTAGQTLTLLAHRGAATAELRDALGGIAATVPTTPVSPQPIVIIGARQDLNLDPGGHKVSVLWNRPVKVAAGDDLLAKFTAQVHLNKDGVNYTGSRPMSAAALQDGSRVANVTFDHSLSQNATYSMNVAPLVDPLSNAAVNFPDAVVPVIDNDAPGGIIFGHVLKGDNSPIGGANVQLLLDGKAGPPQFDKSAATDGSFLFEFVPRDIDNGLPGSYILQAVTTDNKSTSLNGAVRLPGRVHFVNLVFLGRGSAEGYVRYDNGDPVPAANIVVGSTMFDQFRSTTADASGHYSIGDLPVGPLTFSATDAAGNVAYAASEIKTPGQVLVQNLSIFRKPFPGTATIRGVVKRSDTNAVVPGTHVGVYTQGYGLADGFTDGSGRFEFTKVPAGFVTVLAAEWSVSREATALDFDLGPDETRDLTLVLNVKPPEAMAVVEGDVVREDPLHPGDANFYQKVDGALVKIDKYQAVTADATGHYTYTSVPVSFAGKNITAYDPATKRTATTVVPALDPSHSNNLPIFISTASGYGEGTVRVKLLNAAGFPVNGFRVIEPGFPPFGPTVLEASPSGIYQMKHVAVGKTTTVWAIGDGSGPFGDQWATGSVKVEFNGHVASLTLRLPGQGTVRTRLQADIAVIGDVKIVYQIWDETIQGLSPTERTVSTAVNGQADYATFSAVPALENYTVSSQHPVYGYASQSGKLGFDGDVQSITLQLNKLSTVRGVVYAIDGKTPVAGAAVHIVDGRQNQGIHTTLPDGSFEFFNEPAAVGFQVIAEVTQDGVYRTGIAYGNTPPLGGPVDNVGVIMRTQGAIDGHIVYAGYKKYDPQNSANNIIDDTPNDLSDNAPVPLGNFVLRELDFPYRSFGTTADPLTADIAGRFAINNVFTGPLRVSATDPGNQEIRGTYTGTISQEGERITAYVAIGATGFGPVTVTVVDPNAQNAPVLNAEVTLIRNFVPFDLSTTDATGKVIFNEVPVGNYSVTAYSKALGKSGTSATFTVATITGAQVEVVLQFSGKVNGTLSDPQAGGRGVPGVPVTLTATGYQTRASTDVAGAFVFDGIREGTFRLDAKDTESNRRATASHNLTQADPNPIVNLQLEPTETLNLSVYLPDDSGGNSNILAPLVNIDVHQRSDDFFRSLQGNAFQMPGLFKNEPYSIFIKEVGGDARQLSFAGSFPTGSPSSPLKLVLPAFGAAEVHVTQGSAPAANAKVTMSGGAKSVTVFTDGTGVGLARGLPLGSVSVQVVSVDGAFSGSTTATIASQSTPAVVNITLGAFAGISGLVDAETSGPSVGTRVVATFSNRLLEAVTDATGRYTFQGIPTSTTVNLTYIGPDDVTVGARQTVTVGAGDASRIIEAPRVRLDATPPQVVSLFPADASSNVSPDASMKVTFTERIQTAYINTTYIQLVPADSTTPVNGTYSSTTNADGTFTVSMTPPPPAAGEHFPLRSNTLYRIIVSGEIRDLTGNKLPAARGASFITSDYAEPHVVKVIPAVTTPLQAATTFEFRFNEPIDPTPWNTGGSGQFHLYKISSAGPGGAIVAEKPGHTFTDPANGLSLFFTPNDPIEQESFYRVTFSGITDLQGNALVAQTFHFFSYDLVKPFVNLVNPVPATFPLISGSEYVLGVDLRNGDANGTTATDIAKVDYFRVDGGTATYIFTATAAPWSYRFVAPEAPAGGSTLTLRAVATDLSLNESAAASITWDVKPNQAPQNVAVTMNPAGAIYPGNHALASVTFDDEGTQATVQVDASATKSDGSAYAASLVKTITRSNVSTAWPAAQFDFDLPATLKQGTKVTFSASVTDVRGLKGTGSAQLDLSVDTIAPQVLSLTPASGTRYSIGQKYSIVAVIKDSETGASEVTFAFDNQTIKVTVPSALVSPGADHTWVFNSGQITVPAKNVDTTIPITITAKDYSGNPISKSTEVVYVGVNDPTVPKGAWLCPIEKAVFPANSALSVKLQARATDDIAVTGVKFTVPGITDPVAATRVGTTDVYEATATLTTGAAGTPLTLIATVSDANPDHDITLPIAVDVVAVDITVDDRIQAITPTDVPNYQNKSIFVRGVNGRLIPHAAITLKNLIVLDGARVDTLSTTTTTEHKLDLTVSDRLYVDCASSIDVTARGYVGGWGVNGDGSNTKNNDNRGITAGNVTTGGPTPGASASYGGLGGQQGTGVTNTIYGSISNPVDLGTGGAGNPACCFAGAPGGSAIRLAGGTGANDLSTFAIAGAVRADGGSGVGGAAEAGSGGSVAINARTLIVGPSARITANGGDDDASSNNSRGAGGGRVAVVTSDRLDVETVGVQMQARGGRNNTSTESASFLDGGAGTVFLLRPGQTLGDLFAGSYDERFVNSAHLTRPTPLVGAALNFDHLTLGARSLVRADDSITINSVTDDRTAATIDPTAVLVLKDDVPSIVATPTPASGGSMIQTATLGVTYTATSPAGVGAVTLKWSPVTPDRVDSYFSYPPSATPNPAVQLAVPFDAPPGPATLTLSAVDRAGRSAQLAPIPFTIVANAAPVIDKFEVTPSLSVYPGTTVTATTSEHDDLKVTKITFTSTIGTGTPSNIVIAPNVPTLIDQRFNVTVPIDTPGAQDLKLDLAVEDGFPNRTATRQTQIVTILKDTVAPATTITSPANNALFNEGSSNTISVRVTINDAEVGVKSATVQIEGGAPVTLTKSGADYIATLPVPNVDGTDIVTKTLTVTAKDYEGNAATPSVTIRIQPLVDPNAPVINWACPSGGAMFPAGYSAKLRVFALGNNVGNPSNGIQKIEMFIDDSTTPLTATPVSGLPNYYEVVYPIPSNAVAGSTVSVRTVATNVSGLTEGASTFFTIVAGQTITADKTITAADHTFDNQVVIVQGGTTTILGAHTFDKLVVLDGAKVTHPATDATTIQRLNITATNGVFISCTGSIDVSQRGLTGSVGGTAYTYDPATDKPTLTGGATVFSGGSHGGVGGNLGGIVAATYGSPFDPNTPGGSGANAVGNNCSPCRSGGGVARVVTSSLVLDGKILANGQPDSSSGAGGSIRIDAGAISGGGEIHADGGINDTNSSAGGGRVALYYQTNSIPTSRITAATLSTRNTIGAPGTVYLRQVDAGNAKLFDELIVDNLGLATSFSTVIATAGSGTVSVVSGNVVTLSGPVPFDIQGTWIDFLDGAGNIASSYEITARTATTVTLRLGAGETAANASAGQAYRGVARVDRMTARGLAILESSGAAAATFLGAPSSLFRFTNVDSLADTTLQTATMEVNGTLTAPNLTLTGSTLTHSRTTATAVNRLGVNVAGTLTVDAASNIDVSARGITGSVNGVAYTYDRAADKPTLTGGATNFSAGSHGGLGGVWTGNVPAAYGSPFDPNEPGSASAGNTNSTCSPCRSGGGVARIKAGTLQLAGKILANGESTTDSGAAGGSIRIDAGTIAGAGEIHADGGQITNGASGGGGRIAIYYQTNSIPPAKITAAALVAAALANTGAPGTIYLRQNDASGAKLTDELVVDNLGRATNLSTSVVTAGSGTVTAVNGNVVTLSGAVPFDVEGTSIEFLDATGNVIATYEITARTSTTVTLRLASGETSANVPVGSAYRGMIPVDRVTARGAALFDSNGAAASTFTSATGGVLRFGSIHSTHDITLQSANVELNGTLSAPNLTLAAGSTLAHSRATATTINRLLIDVPGTITVDATSAIDVSARGLTGALNGTSYTYDKLTGKPSLTGGATSFNGGSHGGQGGLWTGNTPPAFGSLFDPNEPGGAGAGNTGNNCLPCRSGGGVVRIKTGALQLDGKIQANGESTTESGAAGGSVRIDAATIAGAGEIHADGGQITNGASGSGGRIAIYYTALSIPAAKITAAGLLAANTNATGAPGTIYLKSASQLSGDLIVDNLGRTTTRSTVLTSVGYSTVTAVGADTLTDSNAQFLAPDQLRGVRAFVNHDKTKSWPIVTNDDKVLHLDVSGQALTAQTGQSLRGLYKLDSLKLRNAKLDVIDVLDLSTAVDKDAASSIVGNNQGPPALNAASISLQSIPTGSAVLGAAGAVTDLDTPIALFATNTRTANVYTTTAAADGSFAIAVQGNAGDTITLKARDANTYPLESPVMTVGQLVSGTPVPSQINKTDWTTDTNFLARTLSRDGSFLAVASYPTGNGFSDKLVILGIADPAHPNLLRTVPSGAGTIRDVVVQNGWAYVAADRFFTLDLTNPSSTPIYPGDFFGSDNAVVLSGGYAFTAEVNNNNDGRINIYDVANPATPRALRQVALAGFGGYAFSDLLAYGNDYLIGISPNKPGGTGHDVMVIDRRDVNALKKVADFDVPNFDAFRGTIVGTNVYLISNAQAKAVVVDLSTPTAPSVAGTVTLPAVSGGITIVGRDGFVANGTAGLITLDVTNPAAPVMTGTTTVGGNAFDVTPVGAYVYVANETGVALVPAQIAPQIALTRITMSLAGTTVTVAGQAQAITGNAPIKIDLTNTTNSATVTNLTVNGDGSFSATLAGAPGDSVTIKATDVFGRISGPLSLGTVPFGSATHSVTITQAMSDAAFFPRNIATGGNWLAVSSYPTDNGSSDKIVLFDVTDRANPVYKRTVPSASGALRDLTIVNGWLIFASDRLGLLDLSNPTSAPIFPGDFFGSDNAVTVVDGFAYTAEVNNNNDGRINIYDVSTPSSPRQIRQQAIAGFGGYAFSSLAPLGSRYLVGVSPNKPGGTGHDLMVIDHRDIGNLVKIADFDIPNFDAFHVTVVGNTAYITGGAAGIAVVDLTNPKVPVLVGIVKTPGNPRRTEALGAIMATADGSAGATFLDITAASLPSILGNQQTGGDAWDVAFNAATLYVANDTAIAVIDNLGTPPLVDRSLITILSANGGTMATVAGAPKSILGLAPITYEIRNTNSGASISGLSVAADGSFNTLITAVPGDPLTIKATDNAGRVSGPFLIGTVPFGSTSTSITITPAMTDANFFARNIATGGNWLAVASYPTTNGSSDKIVIYDITNRANPVYKRTVPSASGALRDLEIVNGWLIFASDRLGTLDLNNPASTPIFPGDFFGSDNAVTVVDGFAFTAEVNNNNDGRINIYDVSTPASPRLIRQQAMAGFGGYAFSSLAVLGSDYLIGVSPNKPGGTGHDLMVIDRRDVANLKKVADFDVPNFDAFRVAVVGTRAYIAGVSGGLAVVDLTNPLSPSLIGIVTTPGYPRGLDAMGATLAIADASGGATFVDISPAGLPVVIGNQPTGGDAWDCAFNSTTLYLANETGIAVIDNLGTPPLIDTTLITTSSNGGTTATVTGAVKAILGLPPITMELRNASTGVSVPGIAIGADGSFSASITAVSGDALTVKATDSANRVSGPVSIGTVPFGSATNSITITPAMTDANFFARLVAADGNDLVVASYPTSNSSDKLVIFDVSTPGVPVYKRTVSSGAGAIRDIAIRNRWLIFAADRVGALDLSSQTSTPVFPADFFGSDNALSLAGGYVYSAEVNNNNDGRVNMYDFSSPGAPRLLFQKQLAAFGGYAFSGLTSLGTDYLIGISPNRPGGTGHDIFVIDRRDVNNIAKLSEFEIANFDAFRGASLGNFVYLTGVENGVAIVDMTNPLAPSLAARYTAAGAARQIDIAGTTLAVANGSNGVSLIDVSTPTAPHLIGAQAVPGSAWGVALSRGAMYVATEVGLTAIANVAVPPMLNQSLLTITPAAATTTVQGSVQALTGIAPITVVLKNTATNVTSTPVTVNPDGSWTATVSATPGQPITVTATDPAGRITIRSLGSTFGTTNTQLQNPAVASSDASYRARRVTSDGTFTAVTTGSVFGTVGNRSANLLLHKVADASDAPQVLTESIGGIYDVVINGGYLYLVGDRLATINLADPTLGLHLGSGDPFGSDGCVAVSNGFAFTGEINNNNDGRINIYNVSNPGSPAFVRQQIVGAIGGLIYRAIVPFGSAYIVALTPDRPSGVDHDITILDRTSINNLVKVSELPIPNFDALDGVVDGATLYVAGGEGGVAVVDMTNPFAPVVKSIINTPGIARGIALDGPNKLVVADAGGPGLTFIDVTDKTAPVITGTQQLNGNPTDVDVVGKNIYVGAENYFHSIIRP
jgi:hypothetical protein